MSDLLNFDWLAGVPMGAARAVFLVLFVLIGIIVVLVPKAYIYAGVKHPRWWHNLKIWAVALLALIFATYAAF